MGFDGWIADVHGVLRQTVCMSEYVCMYICVIV